MSQGALKVPIASNPPNTAPAAMAGDFNDALAAVASMNAGSSSPTNYGQTAGGAAGAPVQGQTWLDQSNATYPVVRAYDGSVFEKLGVLDTVQNVWTPLSGGAGSIAAAATTDLGTVPSDYIIINGNNGGSPITSFGSSAPIGAVKRLSFGSNPVIQYSASAIITPWAANLYVRTGATWIVEHLGAGVWIGLCYSDSGGAPCPAPGTLDFTAAISAPDGWLLSYGQTLAKATYPGLYAALVATATVTITIASPGVVTWTAHGLRNNDQVKLRTTGALPTGLSAGVTYYAIIVDGNSFQLAASSGGAAINTSGSQSGTHTGYYAPHGDVDANNFLAPNGCDVALIGKGDMGGVDRGLITSQRAVNLGAQFGEDIHTLTVGELPSHTHNFSGTTSAAGSHIHSFTLIYPSSALGGTQIGTYSGGGSAFFQVTQNTGSVGNHTHTFSGTTDSGTGGGGAHNNLQPSLVCNLMVKF